MKEAEACYVAYYVTRTGVRERVFGFFVPGLGVLVVGMWGDGTLTRTFRTTLT